MKLIEKHKDAFFAGSAYPDAFDDGCFNGQYTNISVIAHSSPFLEMTIDYIRNLPQPWDNSTEKLVTFLFGVASHQISDILWEGDQDEGVGQSFLSTMAKINFHGSEKEAKLAGDIGADVVNLYQLYWDYMDFLVDPEWYVPTDDLVTIHNKLYGKQKVNRNIIDQCTTLQLMRAIEEEAGLRELYSEAAASSPFLINQLTDYFIGGLDDMTVWSQRLWNDVIKLLENGTEYCSIAHSNKYLCKNNQAKQDGEYLIKNDRKRTIHHQSTYKTKGRLSVNDFEVRKKYRGITVQPKPYLKNQILNRRRNLLKAKDSVTGYRNIISYRENISMSDYTVNNTYAKFGWAFKVYDIDRDGNDDIIVGAPRYSDDDDPLRGRVYIIYGTNDGFLMSAFEAININTYPNITIIRGPHSAQSRFGSSVAVVDINLDGYMDLAVGAPAFSYGNWAEFQLHYTVHIRDCYATIQQCDLTQRDVINITFSKGNKGAVYIYFGKGNRKISEEPDLTIKCKKKYCNLGHTLEVSDINSDGRDDLVLSTPFYSSSANQSGIVSSLFSSPDLSNATTVQFEDLLNRWQLSSKQAYSWFGYNIRAKNNVLLISQPNFRLCSRQDCNFSPGDKQSVGRLNVFNINSKFQISNITLTGTEEFQALGYSSDIGHPYGDNSLILAVGIPGASVNGSVFTVPFVFPQAGVVVLYNVTNDGPVEISRFEGNRHYDRFGDVVKFEDVNGDGIDDLIISAPLFSDDWSGIAPELIPETGRVFIYFGGKYFLTGNATRKECNYKHIVYPCPGRLANMTMINYLTYSSSRFGLNVEVVKTKTKKYMAYTAPYTNMASDEEESGKFAMYIL